MKKTVIAVMVVVSFLTAVSGTGEAMNNESAALLTAGILIFGTPVIQALTGSQRYYDTSPFYQYQTYDYGYGYSPSYYEDYYDRGTDSAWKYAVPGRSPCDNYGYTAYRHGYQEDSGITVEYRNYKHSHSPERRRAYLGWEGRY